MTILLLSSIIFAAGVVLNPALLARGKDRLLVRATTISALLMAAAFVPLVRGWGVEGGRGPTSASTSPGRSAA